MDESVLISIAQRSLLVTIYVAAPFLIVDLIVGSLISLFQAATQISEATLTFVPKMVAGIAILVFLGSWIVQQMTSYTTSLFISLPSLVAP